MIYVETCFVSFIVYAKSRTSLVNVPGKFFYVHFIYEAKTYRFCCNDTFIYDVIVSDYLDFYGCVILYTFHALQNVNVGVYNLWLAYIVHAIDLAIAIDQALIRDLVVYVTAVTSVRWCLPANPRPHAQQNWWKNISTIHIDIFRTKYIK